MRHDLVAAALSGIAAALFADVDFTPVAGSKRRIVAAIDGVEVGSTDTDFGGPTVRQGTHVAHGVAALFPDIGRGALLDELDGAGNVVGSYRVLEVRPWGDGRLEIEIGLEPA